MQMKIAMKARKRGESSSKHEAVASLRAADAVWLKAHRAKDVMKAVVGFCDERDAMLAATTAST
jgi:hypothetical protein